VFVVATLVIVIQHRKHFF